MTEKALDRLIGTYLYQSFTDEYRDAWAAVEDFALSEFAYASLLRCDVNKVLARYSAELELDQYLDHLGLGYHPPADGWTSYRDWLLAVADRVDEILRTTREHPTAV